MKHGTTLRKTLLAVLIAGGAAGTLTLPGICFAQSASANLRGTAPPNAQITARNTATGQVRTTKSSASGSYVLVGLPPGTWNVNAGPGTAQTVTLSVASTSTLDLAKPSVTPKKPQKLAAVTVVGRALLDVKTSQVGETVSQRQIDVEPQVTRNFLEFADTVPGMIFSINSSGNTSLQSGAQSSNGVNVYIDGISQKSQVMGGGIAGQFASQGNPFPQLAIGQYRVITSNYEAQYGQLTSGLITAETKYGTNQFHGQAYMSYTNSNHRAETPVEEAAGKKTVSMDKEYGFSLGGPIVKDKAHFFITDTQKIFNTPEAVVPGSGLGQFVPLLPASVQAQIGPANQPFFENLFFGDMDWEIDPSDRLVLRAQLRRETQDENIGGVIAASAGVAVKNSVRNYQLEWEHSANNWYNKFLITYQRAFYEPEGVFNSGIGQVYTVGSANNGQIIQVGAPSPLSFQNKGQKGPGFKDSFTFTDIPFFGDHTLKLGAQYQDLTLVAQDSGDATAQAFFNVCPTDSTNPLCPPGVGSAPYEVQFAAPAAGVSPLVRTNDKQYDAYVQDNWTVNQHLTLNLGVRWDMERNGSYLNWVTPANIVAALNSQNPYPGALPGQTYAESLALGGVNLADYVANGHNRHANKHNWQPRFGFSYDLEGNEKHVVFGGAGRSYDTNLYNYLQLEQTKLALGEFTQYFSSAKQPCKGQPCVAWDPAKYGTIAGLQTLASPIPGASEVDMFNNNLKQPYSDQFSLGMRNKVGAWNTSLAVVRVVSKDNLVATLGNRYPDGGFWQKGSQPFSDPIPGLGSLILWNNGIETRNTQILLSANKPYTPESGWGVTVAYTHTNAHQNRDITNGPYSFDQETIRDYPFVISNFAPKNRLVVTGNKNLPWGLVFSGKLTLATPTPFDGFLFFPYPATLPNGADDRPTGGTPPGNGRFLFGGKIFGYRSVDVALIKNFRLTDGKTFYARVDLLNALNFHNLVDINAPYPDFFPLNYIETGNITGVPRTLKFTAGFKF